MRKNSAVFSFFRILAAIFAAGALGMLYWSSLLIEEDLKTIKKDLKTIRQELADKSFAPKTPENSEPLKLTPRPHVNALLPNLLVEDPFYETTLPQLLGKNFVASGIRKQATVGKPDNLHPFGNFADAMHWKNACSVAVSKSRIGFFEQYVPNAAYKVEERMQKDSVEYWVHLREGLFWQPLEKEWFSDSFSLAPHFLKKHPVTANDFKLYYDAATNPFISNPLAVQSRELFDDILEMRVIDDLTFFVKWKTYPITLSDGSVQMRPKYLAKAITLGFSPLASFVYLYYPDGSKIVEDDGPPDTYKMNSTFAQTFSEHWSKNIIPSCGPFKFKGLTDRMIKLERNSDFFDPLAALVEGMEIEFKPAQDNIWQSFKQGALDNYSLQADQILEFSQFIKTPSYLAQSEKGMKINRLDYTYRAFTYIGWNQARPLFKSKKVRQALTLAIDRDRIIHQILHGMGIEMAAPFSPTSDANDPSIKPWPYDPALAKRFLEEEGFFDLDGDGIIEKTIDGKIVPFIFSLTYYVKNPTTKSICEYISTALKEIGINCDLNGVDLADISGLFDDKNFDAYFLSWTLTDPPEDLTQLWHSSGAKEKGSPNSIGFVNLEVDKIIAALSLEYDKTKRQQLYHRFAAIFHEEQPYTLLYTPRIAMLYREYLQNVFLPIDRQDLIPGAVTAEPESSLFWIKK